MAEEASFFGDMHALKLGPGTEGATTAAIKAGSIRTCFSSNGCLLLSKFLLCALQSEVHFTFH